MAISKFHQFNIIFLCIPAFFLLNAVTVYAASLEIDNPELPAVGNSVTYTISINSAPDDIMSLGFDMVFDSDILSYQSFQQGALTNDFVLFNVNVTPEGNLRIGGLEYSDYIIAGTSGTIATVTFQVIGSGDPEMRFAAVKDDIQCWDTSPPNTLPAIAANQIFQAYKCSPVGTMVGTVVADDYDDDLLDIQIIGGDTDGIFMIDENGIIKIQNDGPLDTSLETSYTLTLSASDCKGEVQETVVIQVIPGNVNNDNQIDLTDAVIVLKLLSGIRTDASICLNSDVDGDNSVGLAELAFILRYVAGL